MTVIFRRLAQGRRGGYVKVRVDERLDQHDVTRDRAAAVARCVVGLFNGRPCDLASHPDLEEAWRPMDMALPGL